MCNCAATEFRTNAKAWIQKAIKHPGSFHQYASQHGGLDGNGKIKPDWAAKVAADQSLDPLIRRRARFFLTLSRLK